MMTVDQEREQIKAMAAGDQETFAWWASRAEGPLRRSLRAFATVVDTEAVLQEALLRIWQVAPRFEHDGQPNALLRLGMRTVRNVAISECRRYGKVAQQEALEQHLLMEATIGPEEIDPHLRRRLHECGDKLPPQPKSVLGTRLRAAGTSDDATLAKSVGMSLNTFLQNFTRARKLMRECLEAAGIRLEEERR